MKLIFQLELITPMKFLTYLRMIPLSVQMVYELFLKIQQLNEE